MFVHGTGVREPAYTACFRIVQDALVSRLGASRVRLERCYWGETCGTKLFRRGTSIPEFDATKAIDGVRPSDAEYEIALWSMLYDDPCAELELLAFRQAGAAPPPGTPPAAAGLERRVRSLTASLDHVAADLREPLRTNLDAAGLLEDLEGARDAILRHPAFRAVMTSAVGPSADDRLAVARALVAEAVRQRRALGGTADSVWFDGEIRDRIVQLLADALGEREMAGPIDWVKRKAGRFVATAGTRYLERRRGRFSEQLGVVAADVLAYQARPNAFRAYIRRAVESASAAALARGEDGDVTVIAHSLGGIAAVEMLIEDPLPALRRLVTVGSQAPFLYELDALGTLPLSAGQPGRVVCDAPAQLPQHFAARWLNVYDPRDFLSYCASPIFAGFVKDVKVDNRQPFPESHGAYWTNRALWDAVIGFVNEDA